MKFPNLVSLRVLRKILRWAAGALVVYTLVGFLVVPLVLKSVLTSQLTAKLHREVTIQEIWFNPFMLSLEVNGFSIKDSETDEPFVSFKELSIDFQIVSVFKEGPILRDIRLRTPHVTIIRNEDLTYNFSDLLQEFAAKPAPDAPPPPEAKPFRYSLNNIRIEDGSLNFQDRPKHAEHTVQDINIGIPFLSNLSYEVNLYVQPAFAAKVNGTPIVLTGKTKPFSDPREAALEVNINNVEIPKYVEYAPAELKFKVPSGSLDTKLSLSFTQYKDKPPALIVTGKMVMNQLSVIDLNERPLLSLPLLDVAIDSLDVFARKVSLGTILLQSPEVHLWREKTGVLNVTTLTAAEKVEGGTARDEPQPNPPADARPNLEVAEVRLTDGKVTFADEATEKPFQTTVEALNLAVHHLSNTPTKPAEVEVSLTTAAGESLKHTGELILEPFAVAGTVELQRIPLKYYAPYYEKNLLFDVEDGVLDLSAHYKYAQGEGGGQTTLAGLAATLSSVQLKRRGEKAEFLKIPLFAVKDTALDLTKQTLVIGEVSSQKGAVMVTREKDGTLNLGTLLPQTPTTETQAASSRTHVVKETPPPSWLVTLKKLTLDGYAVRLEDKAPAQPVTLVVDPVSLTAENFSTAQSTQVKTSLRLTVNKTGTLSVDGTVSLSPLSANLKVDLKGLDLVSLQPYFADKIKITVTSGAVSANGNLALNATPGNDVKVAFTGQASLTKFTTVEKASAEDFLKWKSLYLNGINANTGPPFRLEIGEVALADFYSRLIINPDTTLNVQGIVASEPKASVKVAAKENSGSATGAQKPGEAALIKIAKVTLQGGNIKFSDHFIKPNYSANLVQVGGRISGLASEPDKQADVDLRGRLENSAPLEISGKLNPFGKDLYVDLSVDFKDIDLSPMTPYAGKYAGYTIAKGKLSLNLKYLIENRKLSAQNKVIIDQFTFGEQTNSPDATKLPVRLAVSLLKDRNGAITLDFPMAGSLDDPQFSVWGVIVQLITNILAKAATAPFALLGAVFGEGGETSNSLEFDYGRANLESAAEGKLKTLATALVDRPSLKLEISGYVDTDKDVEGLRQYRFERKLKAQKLNETMKKSEAEVSLDDLKIEPDEYSKYLALAYKKETFPKPRNVIGLAKDLPDPEMEKLMLTHIEVAEADLEELAEQRVKTVEDYLLQTGQVEAERVFLVKPKTLGPEKKDGVKDSRVDFVIQ
ncbi:MAG: DUF748 domain-containing protein [Deltaproteobacteria bacterium]|nr:DUF748 domain-containing protein [Deltaproteobacteria bacterium]